jgi:hypothetical protein
VQYRLYSLGMSFVGCRRAGLTNGGCWRRCTVQGGYLARFISPFTCRIYAGQRDPASASWRICPTPFDVNGPVTGASSYNACGHGPTWPDRERPRPDDMNCPISGDQPCRETIYSYSELRRMEQEISLVNERPPKTLYFSISFEFTRQLARTANDC